MSLFLTTLSIISVTRTLAANFKTGEAIRKILFQIRRLKCDPTLRANFITRGFLRIYDQKSYSPTTSPARNFLSPRITLSSDRWLKMWPHVRRQFHNRRDRKSISVTNPPIKVWPHVRWQFWNRMGRKKISVTIFSFLLQLYRL